MTRKFDKLKTRIKFAKAVFARDPELRDSVIVKELNVSKKFALEVFKHISLELSIKDPKIESWYGRNPETKRKILNKINFTAGHIFGEFIPDTKRLFITVMSSKFDSKVHPENPVKKVFAKLAVKRL
jgi:hypothetical protein